MVNSYAAKMLKKRRDIKFAALNDVCIIDNELPLLLSSDSLGDYGAEAGGWCDMYWHQKLDS